MSESDGSLFDLSLRDKRLLARIIEKLAELDIDKNSLPSEAQDLMAIENIDLPHLLLFFKHQHKLASSTNQEADNATSASELWDSLSRK